MLEYHENVPADCRWVEQRADYDCLTACIATVFNVPYEAAPLLSTETGDSVEGWIKVMDDWCADRGFQWLQRVRETRDGGDVMRCPWAFDGYWIAGVQSPRIDGEHAVVMRGQEIVWDPHPKRDMGHLGFMSCDYFVALDPGNLRRVA